MILLWTKQICPYPVILLRLLLLASLCIGIRSTRFLNVTVFFFFFYLILQIHTQYRRTRQMKHNNTSIRKHAVVHDLHLRTYNTSTRTTHITYVRTYTVCRAVIVVFDDSTALRNSTPENRRYNVVSFSDVLLSDARAC